MFVYNSDRISQDLHNKVAVCQVLINLRLLVSPAGRALVCEAGGRGFKSRPQKQSSSLNYWEASDAFVMTSANGYTFLRILGCKDENLLVPCHSTFTYLVRVRVRNVDPNPNLPWALWVICKERYRSCNLMILFQESKWLPVDIQCMYVWLPGSAAYRLNGLN